jgi:outer membrane protein insertion porin family
MLTGALNYGYPISEFQGVQWGLSASRDNLLASENGSALQSIQWVRSNGSTYTSSATVLDGTGATTTFDFYGTKFNVYQATAGWSYDTRNRALFADRGMRTSITGNYALPGTDVRYFSTAFQLLKLQPLWRGFVLAFKTNIDYGNKLGDTTALPPFAQYYAGGPDTVRGFRESRLGPKDSFGNPYGGNLLTVANLELLFPTPDKWKANVRVSAFYDMGNVFETDSSIKFYGQDGITPETYKFSYNQLKRSVGIAVQWLAPMGVFRFSYAIPLNATLGDGISWPDQREGFQFSIGNAF